MKKITGLLQEKMIAHIPIGTRLSDLTSVGISDYVVKRACIEKEGKPSNPNIFVETEYFEKLKMYFAQYSVLSKVHF